MLIFAGEVQLEGKKRMTADAFLARIYHGRRNYFETGIMRSSRKEGLRMPYVLLLTGDPTYFLVIIGASDLPDRIGKSEQYLYNKYSTVPQHVRNDRSTGGTSVF